jgi:Lrp/AsnC family leucine-responsive transcriptional regulator
MASVRALAGHSHPNSATAAAAPATSAASKLGTSAGLMMSERVRKLEEAGVIEGYGARTSLRSLGLALQAIVRVRTTHEHISSYVRLFEEMPEVLEVDRLTGEDCFIVRCAFAEPRDLERVVDALAAHGSVTTSLVLSSAVRKRTPLQPRSL